MLPVASYPVFQTEKVPSVHQGVYNQQLRRSPCSSSSPSLPHRASRLLTDCFSASPDEVTAEDEAQDEDEDARAKDDHVDVKRQVLEGDGWHGARLVGVIQSQTTEAPCTKKEGGIRLLYRKQLSNQARRGHVML